MNQPSLSFFEKLRSVFFPIQRSELKKFLPMALMLFFVLFNYTLLRDTKDTLVVHAAGAEALSLIKLIGTVPGAIIAMLIYAKLSNLLSRQTLFYVCLAPFILFFAAFAYLIYPNLDTLHPSAHLLESFVQTFPRLKTLGLVFGSWSFALFYVLAELWGSVVLSLLFWQFANEVVRMDQAKRFYSFFGVISSFGVVAAGLTIQYFSHIRSASYVGDPWAFTLNYLTGALLISSAFIIGLYWFLNKKVLPQEEAAPKEEIEIVKEKPKLNLIDSFKLLIQSKNLRYIALMVICYGISQNVTEAVWKGQIKEVYRNMNDYSAFMGKFSAVSGVLMIAFMLMGGWVIRTFGWLRGAIMTPIMILGTSLPFFTFVTFKDQLEPFTTVFLGISPAMIAVVLGFFQNMLSKSTKYSLFDPTKEMSYIPLDIELKTKGKAAVDVVGARLGKSGGSIIQQLLLIVTGQTLAANCPYLAAIVLVTIVVWMTATKKLSRLLISKEEKEEVPAPTET